MKALSLAAAALVTAAAVPAPSPAQTLEQALETRSEAMPRGKHAWQETWLVPESGPSAPVAAQVRKFAGRVTAYPDGDRERLELRAASGDELGEPLVVVSDGEAYWLVTQVGASPLVQSAKASDPWLALILSGPPGDAPTSREVPAEGGGIAAVVLRAPAPSDFDTDLAFALKLSQGGSLELPGLARFSPGANPNVTAAAGARGVGQVETANGPISVTPDPEAVRWMEAQQLPPVALERFLMEVRLAPYDALPEEPGT